MERILRIFDRHAKTMEQRAQERFDAVKLESLVDSRTVRKKSSEDEMLGKRLPRDEFAGDVNFRTLQALLKKIDDRGYERVRSLDLGSTPPLPTSSTVDRPSPASQSAHQLRFHDHFLKAAARVLYRDEWSVLKPQIMQKHGWASCPSEVLISTPRRFGKTFS